MKSKAFNIHFYYNVKKRPITYKIFKIIKQKQQKKVYIKKFEFALKAQNIIY